jgi:xylulokinase
MKKYYLGVDIGTYESKGAIVDGAGKVMAVASVAHGLSMPQPGWAEHDADATWWHDFTQLSRTLLSTSGLPAASIAGVGLSTIAPCVLPVDAEGQPLRPAILYGIDTRASAEVEELEAHFGREEIFRHSGVILGSQQTGPKIRWLQNHEPEVWAKTAGIMSGTSYLTFRLTGTAFLDHYTASTYAPMYDPETCRWSDRFCRDVVNPAMLPRLAWSGEVVGEVSRQAAAETGLAAGTPVVCGTADAAAEALSGGVAQPGSLMLMYGSSLFFIAPVGVRASTRVLWPSSFLFPGSFALAGGMSTAGSITRWFRDSFGQQELAAQDSGGKNAYEALAAFASESEPGAGGLVALPYFYGERTPIHDPDACGLIFGLTLRSSRADVYRALLESVAYGIRHNLESLAEIASLPDTITAVGGGTKNRLWMQIVSDATGIPQKIYPGNPGACYGDAFLAALGTGGVSSPSALDSWLPVPEFIRPESVNRPVYDTRYATFLSLYTANRELMQKTGCDRR